MLEATELALFWVVVPRSLVEVYQCFRGLYCFRHLIVEMTEMEALMMEAARTSETFVNIYHCA
jgi:hypothetical protein